VNIQCVDIEMVETSKDLGVHLNKKLVWFTNTDVLYKKAPKPSLFAEEDEFLWFVQVCLKKTFYDSVVASAICYAVACWGAGSTERDRKRLNKLVMTASFVLVCPLDTIEEVGERRMLARLASIMSNTTHPLPETVSSLSSSINSRLLDRQYKKESYHRSFIPVAVKLFNATSQSRIADDELVAQDNILHYIFLSIY